MRKSGESAMTIDTTGFCNKIARKFNNTPLQTSSKKHISAGSLKQYLKLELVGKEEKLYHEALKKKYQNIK